MGKVLAVDDEQVMRAFLEKALTRFGHEVTTAASAEEALKAFEPRRFDVVLSDIRMPGASGLDLLERLTERDPQTPVVIMTAYGTITTAVEAVQRGAADFVTKPIELPHLKLVVERALAKRAKESELTELRPHVDEREQLGGLIGRSLAMKRVYQLIDKVAPRDLTVLILGETGTGKSLCAQAIHELSPRAANRLQIVNCSALQSTLLESELFGHVAGAFTGATSERQGVFEVADGGTLFIDEVGEMSLEIQKKFLRLLENGEFRRLGESRVRRADVRVVAATNRVLSEAVAAGEFREDLFYRLNVVSIRTPPLREHPEDLPLIVDELLEQIRLRSGRAARVEPEALEAFAGYAWPGNVRELRNVLERALVLSPGNTIRLLDCPGVTEAAPSAPAPLSAPASVAAGEASEPLSERLEDVERAHVARILADCEGNKTEASRRLGISLRSLYRKLDKFGLKSES